MDAVIFDLDGVIVDSEPWHEKAFLRVFDELGYRDNHGVVFSDYYGTSDRVVWQDFIERHQPDQTLDELLERREAVFVEFMKEHGPIFSGAASMIPRLEDSYRLAIASGSRPSIIDLVLTVGSLHAHFEEVVSAQSVENGKPAPDVFLRAAELLGVAPEKCWVIEDAKNGIKAGVAAGMRVIAITNSFPREELSEAEMVVDSYEEIEALLLPSKDSARPV
ncbi:MAG: HAD family phosphatase [Verrucomicrobiota bacterium]